MGGKVFLNTKKLLGLLNLGPSLYVPLRNDPRSLAEGNSEGGEPPPTKNFELRTARAGRKPREKKPRETMRGFGSDKLAWELPINPQVELQDSGEKKVVQSYLINGL